MEGGDGGPAARAHGLLGLAGGLATGGGHLLGEDIGFDFAVVEDCAAFDECGAGADAYDLVLAVEYDDDAFAAACAAGGVSVQRRDLAVSTPGTPGYVARWCTR